jgi:Putative DNA-binding domain
MNLRDLQNLLYRQITDPNITVEDLEKSGVACIPLETLLNGGLALSPDQRVDIYANAFFFRLLDCFAEDYSATLAVVGIDEFTAIVKEYPLVYPPTEPSIFYADYCLPDFLAAHCSAESWPFIADLARLERAILDSFIAADTLPFGVDSLSALPSNEWLGLRLQTHPTVAIVHGEWCVAAILRSIEDGQEWQIPAHEQMRTLVWRQNSQVHYRDLELAERQALVALSESTSFSSICEMLAAVTEESDQVALIGRLLARWLADGIIVPPTTGSRLHRRLTLQREVSR